MTTTTVTYGRRGAELLHTRGRRRFRQPRLASDQPHRCGDDEHRQRDRNREVVGVVPQRLKRLSCCRVGQRQGQVRDRRLDEEHGDRRNQHRDNEYAVFRERPRRTRHELHDRVQQHVDGCHEGDAAEQFRRRGPAAGERAAVFAGQQAVLDGRQEQSEKRIHQGDAGQRLVLDLMRGPRLTVAATSIAAVEHEVDDDECETGEDTGKLRVVPGHDRDVEAGPQHAGISDLSRRHRRNTSRTNALEQGQDTSDADVSAASAGIRKPAIVRVDIREHTTRLPGPRCLGRLLAAPPRRQIGGVDRSGGVIRSRGRQRRAGRGRRRLPNRFCRKMRSPKSRTACAR